MSEVSVNKVCFSGQVQDVVIRQTTTGKSVCNFTLLLTDKFVDGKPFRQFMKCVSWQGLGQRVAKMPLHSKVRITGRMETVSWKDKETNAWKHKLQVVCDSCEPVSHLQTAPDQAAIDARPIDNSDIPF